MSDEEQTEGRDSGELPEKRTVEVFPDGSVTIAHAAIVLGMTKMGIRKWIDAGCPAVNRGKRGSPMRVIMSDVMEWRSGGLDDDGEDGERYNLEQSKARRAHMLADMAQMERDLRRGRLVPTERVAGIVEEEYARVRAGVMSLPSKMAVALSTMDDTRAIHDHVRRECVEILDKLSDPEDIAPAAVITDDAEAEDEEDEDDARDPS